MDAISSPHPTEQALSAYGLGKLDDQAAEAVNEHLEACEDCRERLSGLTSDTFLNRIREARKGPAESTWGESRAGETWSFKGPNIPAPPPNSTLPPGMAERPDYEIKKELGRGGMGVVYLVRNTLMDRDEVHKVIGRHLIERPGVLERFLREIRAVASLRHPNIVTAYSASRVGESIVFMMEYVPGYDLSKLVKVKGSLPVAHASNFIHQAALGLQHAHEEGLVHRDIKPGNLMLSRKGDKALIKILDFGLAKVTREQKVESTLTSEGQMLGTPEYIAPEQIRDAQSADIRADVYSLGCTLYYLLAGRRPFAGDNLWDLYQAHFSMDADPLNLIRPEVPSELAALVAKMMAKEPARRFQTPGEVAQALTPFFKKANAAFMRPQTNISQDEPLNADRLVTRETLTPTQPATDAGDPAAPISIAVEPTFPEGRWESMIDFKTTESSIAPTPATVSAKRPSWIWPSVGVGVLLVGLLAAWLGGVFKLKTPDGVIVIENVPRDADIYVDGRKVVFKWPGVGTPLTITAVPGQHKVEVRKDQFTVFGETVTFKTVGSEEVTVRLEPSIAKAAAGVPDASIAEMTDIDPPPANPSSADRTGTQPDARKIGATTEIVPGTPPQKIEAVELGRKGNAPALSPRGGRDAAEAGPVSHLSRLVYSDDFDDPRSGWPQGKASTNPTHGYANGYYFVRSMNGWHAWTKGRLIHSESSLELIGRATSEATGSRYSWLLNVSRRDPPMRGFQIKITGDGQLRFGPSPWPAAKDFARVDPNFSFRNAAIKPGDQFNRLQLKLGKRRVEIFVNDVRVCDPVTFDYDILPAKFSLGAAAGAAKVLAEFDRIEIREASHPASKGPDEQIEKSGRLGSPGNSENASRNLGRTKSPPKVQNPRLG